MSTDIKHGRAQLTKIIISGRFLSTVLGKLAGALMKVCVPLLTFLTPLATMLSASALHGAIQRKMCGRGIAKAGKRTTLVTLNWGMDDIEKVIKWLENSGLLVDWVSEKVKHEIKTKKMDFLVCY